MLTEMFTISVQGAGEESRVVCSGEFDMAVADRFRQAVDEVLAVAPQRVHFDCSQITFVDSLGLRALMHTQTRCRDKGIDMTITLSPQMQRLFDTVGATQMFALA